MKPLDFIPAFRWSDLDQEVQLRARLCLLDLIGVAAGGLGTRLSRIIRDHAVETFGGSAPILFDHRTASPAGAALAAGIERRLVQEAKELAAKFENRQRVLREFKQIFLER